jgi:2-keto-3-deoxy-L-rhamnonate aldolase RhmA
MAWTDADGTDHAQYRTVSGGAAVTHDEQGRAATAKLARRMIKMGYKLVTIANEVAIMVNAAKAIVKDIKSA